VSLIVKLREAWAGCGERRDNATGVHGLKGMEECPMPTAVPADAETPTTARPERRVLARAVGVWWVQRLLEAARRRRAATARADHDDREPAPVSR
jgi:hypothetical protein